MSFDERTAATINDAETRINDLSESDAVLYFCTGVVSPHLGMGLDGRLEQEFVGQGALHVVIQIRSGWYLESGAASGDTPGAISWQTQRCWESM